MRRRFLTLLAATAVFAMIGVAARDGGRRPRDRQRERDVLAEADRHAGGHVVSGEDATTYKKVTGNWKGGEVDFTPGSTDYVLTGKLSFTGGVWTINTATGRGLFTAKAKLVSSAGVPLYSGTITLVTQNLAGTRCPGSRMARGQDVRRRPAESPGVPDGGSLLANVEATILTNGSFAISGQFGDAPPQPGTPDYSVTTINQTC